MTPHIGGLWQLSHKALLCIFKSSEVIVYYINSATKTFYHSKKLLCFSSLKKFGQHSLVYLEKHLDHCHWLVLCLSIRVHDPCLVRSHNFFPIVFLFNKFLSCTPALQNNLDQPLPVTNIQKIFYSVLPTVFLLPPNLPKTIPLYSETSLIQYLISSSWRTSLIKTKLGR